MKGKRKSKRVKTLKKQQTIIQEEEYKKCPHSFVFHRGLVGKHVKSLVADLKKLMEPYTASHLRARKKNSLQDFVSVAGPLNVTHFIAASMTDESVNLKIMRIPKGPTLTFRVEDFCLARDVISSLKRYYMEQKQFESHPLLVMNNFSGDGMHLKLMTTMFQNMFLPINVNNVKLNKIRRCLLLDYDPETKKIQFRHYNIRVVPTGLSRAVKKLSKPNLPDLSKYEDISEFVDRGGNLSESEAELDGPENEVILPQYISTHGNKKSSKSAIRLTEIGPRMCLRLVKIEEGLGDGEVMYHSFVEKSQAEIDALKKMKNKKGKLKEDRKRIQKENLKKKQELKEKHKEKSLEGMKRKLESDTKDVNGGDSEDSDVEHYKRAVGLDPDADTFPRKRIPKRKSIDMDSDQKKKKLKKSDFLDSKERLIEESKTKFFKNRAKYAKKKLKKKQKQMKHKKYG